MEWCEALVVELEQSRVAMEALPSPQAPPPAADMAELTSARRHAEEARRDAATATSALAAARTRREFLEEQVVRLEPLADAVEDIRAIEDETARATETLVAAQNAATELARATAELEGLDNLYAGTGSGPRLGCRRGRLRKRIQWCFSSNNRSGSGGRKNFHEITTSD